MYFFSQRRDSVLHSLLYIVFLSSCFKNVGDDIETNMVRQNEIQYTNTKDIDRYRFSINPILLTNRWWTTVLSTQEVCLDPFHTDPLLFQPLFDAQVLLPEEIHLRILAPTNFQNAATDFIWQSIQLSNEAYENLRLIFKILPEFTFRVVSKDKLLNIFGTTNENLVAMYRRSLQILYLRSDCLHIKHASFLYHELDHAFRYLVSEYQDSKRCPIPFPLMYKTVEQKRAYQQSIDRVENISRMEAKKQFNIPLTNEESKKFKIYSQYAKNFFEEKKNSIFDCYRYRSQKQAGPLKKLLNCLLGLKKHLKDMDYDKDNNYYDMELSGHLRSSLSENIIKIFYKELYEQDKSNRRKIRKESDNQNEPACTIDDSCLYGRLLKKLNQRLANPNCRDSSDVTIDNQIYQAELLHLSGRGEEALVIVKKLSEDNNLTTNNRKEIQRLMIEIFYFQGEYETSIESCNHLGDRHSYQSMFFCSQAIKKYSEIMQKDKYLKHNAATYFEHAQKLQQQACHPKEMETNYVLSNLCR